MPLHGPGADVSIPAPFAPLASHRMLQAVQALQREFIRTRDLRQQAERMLALAIEGTQAGYGFIAEVLRDPQDQPYLKTHAMTDIAWDEPTRALYQEHLAKGLEFRNLDTLFGRTLVTGEVVVSNDPARDVRARGTPRGHPPMHNYIGIPIFSGPRMVGMLALANGPGDFGPELALQLEPLLSTFAVMLQAQHVDRERTQATLRATDAESRLRRITDGVPGAVFQCSAGSGRLRGIHFVSDGAQRLLGLEAQQLRRSPRLLLQRLHRADRVAFRRMIATSARRGLPWAFEFRLRHAAEPLRWLRIEAQCLVLSDGEFEWNGMLFDVTRQKGVERDLREAKDAADSASRAKSSFLAAMSHEIRTPMHAMLGFLELLADSHLAAEQADKVRIVQEAGGSLLRLIDDILDFSRIEAGHVEIRPVATDVIALLQHKLEVWTGPALRKGIALSLQVGSGLRGRFLLDELRLRQVLRNLLSNAIKFTEHGAIRLSVALEPDPAGGDALLAFRVQDTGPGVPVESQARVFHAFEQGDGEITRRHGGSGLGLSISRRLAHLMGGTLEMRSEPGMGTEMILRMPARPGEPVHVPEPQAMPLARVRVGARVLVAEDHPVNRVLITRQLEKLGLVPDLAVDGLEALERWSRQPYDLLLADCHMPRMDGLELTRRIRAAERAQPGHSPLPIIACTADALPETVQACREAGMNDFIAKPVSLGLLASKLAGALPDAASQAGAAASINLHTLDALTAGDDDLRNLALQLFAESAPRDLAALLAAADADDDAALRRECHRLLGLAGTVGAEALGRAVESLQALARQGLQSGREAALSQVRACAVDAMTRAEALRAS